MLSDEEADYSAATKEKMFGHIDNLCDGGATNMYEARASLMAEFNLPQGEAGKVLTEWVLSPPP